jgi:hypothetical protein
VSLEERSPIEGKSRGDGLSGKLLTFRDLTGLNLTAVKWREVSTPGKRSYVISIAIWLSIVSGDKWWWAGEL